MTAGRDRPFSLQDLVDSVYNRAESIFEIKHSKTAMKKKASQKDLPGFYDQFSSGCHDAKKTLEAFKAMTQEERISMLKKAGLWPPINKKRKNKCAKPAKKR